MVKTLNNLSSPTGAFPITNDYGYYAVKTTLNGEDTVIFIECAPPAACPAQQFKLSSQECAIGYNGTRCGTCAQGYYTYSNVCEKCPNLDFPPAALAGLAFVVLIVVLYITYKMSKMDLGFIGVVYTYFQVNQDLIAGFISIL